MPAPDGGLLPLHAILFHGHSILPQEMEGRSLALNYVS